MQWKAPDVVIELIVIKETAYQVSNYKYIYLYRCRQTLISIICYFMFVCTIGNNWYRGRCQDPTQESRKINIGYFLDENYGEADFDGLSACYHNCQVFGVTGCEYHRGDGRCWAHTDPLVTITKSLFVMHYHYRY